MPRFMPLMGSCILIAWRNLLQSIPRTLTALLGTTLAIFMLFLQIEFLDATRQKSVGLYELFDFDLAMVSQFYQFMYAAPPFDTIRLDQARVDQDIEDIFALNTRITRWTSDDTDKRSSMILIGIDERPAFVRNDAIKDALPALRDRGALLMDSMADPDYGTRAVGAKGWIRKHEARVVGTFELGMFFYADGSAIVSNQQFPRIAGRPRGQTTVGLIALSPGSDPATVQTRLQQALPDDVLILRRDELIGQEQQYFVSVKPIGIALQTGMIIAFVIGGVVLYQVLSTDISRRFREFATLKAMGFGAGFVYGIGAIQLAIFAITGFALAALISHWVFAAVRDLVPIPMALDATLALPVFFATLLMCVATGIITLHRLRNADPAVLY